MAICPHPQIVFARLKQLIMLSLACLVSAGVCFGASQDDEPDVSKAKGRIIGRIWHTKVNGGQMFQYTAKVGKELGMQQSPIFMMAGGMGSAMNSIGSDTDVDLKGTAVFLETFPKAGTPHFISFQKVKDLAAFQKYVKAQASLMGGMGELIGEDDKFEVQMNLAKLTVATPDAADGEAKEGGQEKRSVIRLEVRSEVQIGNKSAPSDFKMPNNISTYYRFQDGIMYSGQMKELHFVDLPSQKSMLLDGEGAMEDIHGVFDLTQIPKHLKQALWMSLEAQTLTYMQRFDEEAMGDYSLRHALGQGRLELLKAAMFDVDTAEFSIKFAETDEMPIRAKVKLEARKESQLAQTLQQMSRTPSRLGVLRNDESPLVVSTTFDLPDWTQPLATEFITSLKIKMQESADDDSIDRIIEDLFAPILKAAAESQLDAAVRMEGDFDAGMVLAGGVRLPDAEQFHSTLDTLMLLKSAEGSFLSSRTKIGDVDAITVTIDELKTPFSDRPVPVQIHFAGVGNYVWFAAGGANAIDSLKSHLQNQDAIRDAQVKPMPLLVRMRLSEWMNDDSKGVSEVPRQILNKVEHAIADVFSPMFNFKVNVNGSNVEPKKDAEFVSYADKVLKGKSGDVELTSETFGRTLSINASMGTGVAKFIVAQYASAQNRMFSNMNFNFAPGIEGGGKGTTIRSIRIGN